MLSQDSQASLSTPTDSSNSLNDTLIIVSAPRTNGAASHDGINGSHDGSHDHSSKSHLRTPNNFSEEDNLTSSVDPEDQHPILHSGEVPTLTPGDDGSNRLSTHTSLAALHPGQSSRPHSVVSANDFHDFGFSLDTRGGMACSTMPLAVSWSPKSQFSARRDPRRSQKQIVPASS